MRSVSTCPSCGSLRDETPVCAVCGCVYAEYEAEGAVQKQEVQTPVETNSSPKSASILLFCPKCGSSLQGAPRFCGNCGENLDGYRSGAQSRAGAVLQGGGNVARKSNKPLFIALGAIVVIAGGIIVGVQLFSDKPVATAGRAQNTQPPQAPAPSPTTEQLDAIKSLKNRLAANPNDTAAIRDLANVYSDIDDCADAVPYYQKYISANPKNPAILTDYAYCLFRNGDTQGAIAQMKEAIRINPKFQQAYFNLSIVNLDMKNAKEGLEWLSKCIAIDSTTPIAQQAKSLLSNHAQLFNQQ